MTAFNEAWSVLKDSPQKMCEVCKKNPAMQNSFMCATCDDEIMGWARSEGIEQRTPQFKG